eukprot:TRINITY_DN6_c0_g3_i1.p1 TRINITY_DN6_c0_g3~~TRINITY_DN6_c0_g3_i1.p1  ORF type:complete len:172 (-),score=15.18 TRINITY_DN6_c0_g3_i1:293-808(-)
MASLKLALLVAVVGMALSCVVAAAASDSVQTITFREYYSKSGGVESTVFGPAPSGNSVQEFGKGSVYDYKVTIDDKEVGRSRGLYIHNTVDGSGGQDIFTVTFQAGQYSGSSLALAGHWSDNDSTNEIPVVGGSGLFAFATGSARYQDAEGSLYEVRVTLKGIESLKLHGF